MLLARYNKASQRIFAAPWLAIPLCALTRLSDLKFPFEITDLKRASLAARARLAVSSDALRLAQSTIATALDNDERLLLPPFPSWRASCVCAPFHEARAHFQGIPALQVHMHPEGDQLQRRLHRYLRLHDPVPSAFSSLLRRRSCRFDPHDPVSFGEHLRNFLVNSTSLPPTVRGSILFTWMNAWPTTARFQELGEVCRFGCGVVCDRMEHYLCCGTLHRVAIKHFGLDPDALPDPRHGSLLRRLNFSDDGMRTACFIDCVRHAYLWAKHSAGGDPSAGVASRLKLLQLRHPGLVLLFQDVHRLRPQLA